MKLKNKNYKMNFSFLIRAEGFIPRRSESYKGYKTRLQHLMRTTYADALLRGLLICVEEIVPHKKVVVLYHALNVENVSEKIQGQKNE